MKKLIFFLIALLLGIAIFRFSNPEFIALNENDAEKSLSPSSFTDGNQKTDKAERNQRLPSSEKKPRKSSLSLYIEGNFEKSFNALVNEVNESKLNGFQIEKSLDRLPLIFSNSEVTTASVLNLLEKIQGTASEGLKPRIQADIDSVKIISEEPSLERLFTLLEEYKDSSKDSAPFTTDQKRISFLNWSQAYASRAWIKAQRKDPDLRWLYYIGLSGYQNFGQGGSQLQEYLLRCDSSQASKGTKDSANSQCQYKGQAKEMLKTINGMQLHK